MVLIFVNNDIFELRSRLGVIPQKAFLFHGTIADNIRFGKPDATMEEVEHAAKVAQAYMILSWRKIMALRKKLQRVQRIFQADRNNVYLLRVH